MAAAAWPYNVVFVPSDDPLPWLGVGPTWDDFVGDRLPQTFVKIVGWLFDFIYKPVEFISGIFSFIFERLLALATGSYYPFHGPWCERRHVSIINNSDPQFGVPKDSNKEPIYNTRDFPFKPAEADKNGFHEWQMHFLSLTVKAAYEDPHVVKAIVANEWPGFTFVEHFTISPESFQEQQDRLNSWEDKAVNEHPDESARRKRMQRRSVKAAARLLPQTHAFLIKNDNALVLFFRGTEPFKISQWWTDADLEPISAINVDGRVHQGFYKALFYKPRPTLADDGSKIRTPSIFRRICVRLSQELSLNDELKIYITGHSLGAALSSVFAHTLANERSANLDPTVGFDSHTTLYRHVGGVSTWAGPLAGNNKFAEFIVQRYGAHGEERGRVFRIVHSSDIVTKVPVGLGYYHHPQEYFIAWNGTIFDDLEEIEKFRIMDSDFFTMFWWRKIRRQWTHFGPAGVPSGVPFVLKDVAWVVRNVSRTATRVLFYALGFLFPFHTIAGLPDHWPCDYEQKLRVAAHALATARPPHRVRTTLRTRSRQVPQLQAAM